MARIAGVDLPKNKRGEIGLTYIFGIGPSTARYILDKNNIDRNKKVHEWNDEDLNAIRTTINDEFKVEGALRSEVQMSIKRLLDIACYRGLRHRKGLPVRGQWIASSFGRLGLVQEVDYSQLFYTKLLN